MLKLLERARERQVGVPALRSTDYINTIPPEREPWFPGDEDIERRIRAYIRWNAAIMVSPGQQARSASAATSPPTPSAAIAVRGRLQPLLPRQGRHGESGDQVYFQGHASPGIYARAFLEGRLTERSSTASARRVARAARPARPTRTRG